MVFGVLASLVLAVSLVTAYSVEEYRKVTVTKGYEKEVSSFIEQGIAVHDALNSNPTVDVNVPVDPQIVFIKNYYQNLGSGQLWAAYSVSKKTVSFDTYSSWYKLVTKTVVENVEKIAENKYSIRVQLFEGDAISTYGVLMTLGTDRILDSIVRIISVDEASSFAPDAVAERSFFEANKNLPISISNADFETARKSNVFVLDAREDEEYDLGHYTGSTHTRFADLIAGSWVSLPTDKVVYVFCWSGIRGKALTEFLRSKGVTARYLINGASGWVNSGGAWEGEILFSTKYSDARYTGTLSTKEVHNLVSDGAVLIDSRQTEVFATKSLPGSQNIPIFFTPSDELAKLFAEVPPDAKIITICDDYVSCFDAKIAGVKLEKLGHEFLGRYAVPQDY